MTQGLPAACTDWNCTDWNLENCRLQYRCKTANVSQPFLCTKMHKHSAHVRQLFVWQLSATFKLGCSFVSLVVWQVENVTYLSTRLLTILQDKLLFVQSRTMCPSCKWCWKTSLSIIDWVANLLLIQGANSPILVSVDSGAFFASLCLKHQAFKVSYDWTQASASAFIWATHSAAPGYASPSTATLGDGAKWWDADMKHRLAAKDGTSIVEHAILV